LNKELLDICYKKHNKEINLTWEQLAQQYGFSSGENLRSWFKRIRRQNGEIGYKIKQEYYIFQIIIIHLIYQRGF
jgi:hypothetical protein